METKRREFFRRAGLAGLGLCGAGVSQLRGTGLADADNTDLPGRLKVYQAKHRQQFNMSGYAAPKIDTLRVGIIGLGQRGPSHLQRMSILEGVEIRALCDLLPEKAEAAKKRLEGTDHKPDLYAGSPDAWKLLCQRKDLDLVIITTPWYMHAEMGIYAMEQGKHVASEVPAAGSIEECWKIVETAERTRKHFMMMENYIYMEFQLLMLNLARQGFFGEIVHGDCAYNTSKMVNNFSRSLYWDMWWLKVYGSRKGNFYPTHGLGPVAQMMDICHGDRFDFLVSVESNDFMMRKKAEELAEKDDFFKPFAAKSYRGNMNVTTIRTKNGKTIMLQHDATSPSPHSLIHGIYGTTGAALYDPQPPRLAKGNHQWVTQEEFEKLKKQFTPKLFDRMGALSAESGHGGSDLMLSWHLVDCLRNGSPLDQDVYDAVSLSAIIPLSEWSVQNRSASIDIPDFTSGGWKTNPRNMDINLVRCGDTRILAKGKS